MAYVNTAPLTLTRLSHTFATCNNFKIYAQRKKERVKKGKCHAVGLTQSSQPLIFSHV
ncbi:hypothetical protein MANES_16G091750v8 [Manihot esculenta]|uniref:Uncharacterized protein n=1 Tax=Manihot esculenta TaxID=3983 RepID=A0ACB7G7V6_MANES|nr:hypothetical protein MANES_16G091750v8 [Manihot esculenta]